MEVFNLQKEPDNHHPPPSPSKKKKKTILRWCHWFLYFHSPFSDNSSSLFLRSHLCWCIFWINHLSVVCNISVTWLSLFSVTASSFQARGQQTQHAQWWKGESVDSCRTFRKLALQNAHCLKQPPGLPSLRASFAEPPVISMAHQFILSPPCSPALPPTVPVPVT